MSMLYGIGIGVLIMALFCIWCFIKGFSDELKKLKKKAETPK